MAALAFLFPGQGSQRVGMGADLRSSHPSLFERYLGLADAVTGHEVSRFCLEGPLEELTRTDVAQPALFAVSMALFEYAFQAGLKPAFVAGHSLGEYTAAATAGVVNARDGMMLVAERGALMAKAQRERPGTMAAIVGLALEQVAGLCVAASDRGSVGVANVNAPSQIVVSGDVDAVLQLAQLARDAGAEQVVMLNVGAAFHTPLMARVAEGLAATVERLAWSDPTIPIVTNVTATVASTAAAIREALVEQITRPVDWVGCIGTLRALGVTTFLELGPGRVLTGLARLIDPDIDVFAADSPEKIDRFVTRLAGRSEPPEPA